MDISASELQRWLFAKGACRSGRERYRGQSLIEAWRSARRLDDLLWLLDATGYDYVGDRVVAAHRRAAVEGVAAVDAFRESFDRDGVLITTQLVVAVRHDIEFARAWRSGWWLRHVLDAVDRLLDLL
jgi:hypothetical protein